mmetsp:Transcript_25360/g.59424  ORF Transcript_25360/g.59424 Transcript_25360/m.59424 type:complete len:598 (+) Transcript_25360:1795-3588(+)
MNSKSNLDLYLFGLGPRRVIPKIPLRFHRDADHLFGRFGGNHKGVSYRFDLVPAVLLNVASNNFVVNFERLRHGQGVAAPQLCGRFNVGKGQGNAGNLGGIGQISGAFGDARQHHGKGNHNDDNNGTKDDNKVSIQYFITVVILFNGSHWNIGSVVKPNNILQDIDAIESIVHDNGVLSRLVAQSQNIVKRLCRPIPKLIQFNPPRDAVYGVISQDRIHQDIILWIKQVRFLFQKLQIGVDEERKGILRIVRIRAIVRPIDNSVGRFQIQPRLQQRRMGLIEIVVCQIIPVNGPVRGDILKAFQTQRSRQTGRQDTALVGWDNEHVRFVETQFDNLCQNTEFGFGPRGQNVIDRQHDNSAFLRHGKYGTADLVRRGVATDAALDANASIGVAKGFRQRFDNAPAQGFFGAQDIDHVPFKMLRNDAGQESRLGFLTVIDAIVKGESGLVGQFGRRGSKVNLGHVDQGSRSDGQGRRQRSKKSVAVRAVAHHGPEHGGHVLIGGIVQEFGIELNLGIIVTTFGNKLLVDFFNLIHLLRVQRGDRPTVACQETNQHAMLCCCSSRYCFIAPKDVRGRCRGWGGGRPNQECQQQSCQGQGR